MPIIIGASIENYSVFSVEGSYREGDIRLVGGPHNWEGRVEIFWNGIWEAISDSQWMVTMMLGLSVDSCNMLQEVV